MPKNVLWRTLAPRLLLTLAAGAIVTAWLANQQANENQSVLQSRLEQEAQRISRDVFTRFQLYEYGMRGFRGMLLSHAANGMDRSHVLAYSRSRQMSEFPGARGFGFIERVPREQLDRFLDEARADGAPGFAIRQLTPHDGERFVIRYIEPLENNGPAMGLDIASENNRRTSALAAMRNNAPTITGPITLVQASGAPLRSFLLLLPVYRAGLPTDTAAQREAACIGWTYAPLVTDEVLKGLPLNEGLLRLRLQDVTEGEPDTFFDSTSVSSLAVAPVPELSTTVRRSVFGREWQLSFEAYPAFVEQARLTQPSTIGMAGALVTVLVALLQGLLITTARRKRETAEANALLASIVENASDAIVGESLDGRILTWNKAAEALFGYPRQAVEGKPLATLLLTPERADEDRRLLQLALEQGTTEPFETTRRSSDGRLIDVSMTVSAIRDAEGQVVGASKLLRDISQRKRYEQELLEINAGLEQRVKERTHALNEATRFLLTVLHSVPQMIAYVQADLTHKLVNRAYADAFGLEPNDLQRHPLPASLDPALRETLETRFRAALAGQRQAFDLVWPAHQGMAARELAVECIPDTEHRAGQGFYFIAQDMTETNRQRRELEQALVQRRETERFLERVSRVAGVGGWRLQLADQRLTWTAQTRRISGVDDDFEPDLDRALAFYPTAVHERLRQALEQTIGQGQPFDLELPYVTARGEDRWVRAFGEPEYAPETGSREPVAVIGALMEFTERHREAEALRLAQSAAEQASQSKSAFLANMSHEIRTPLNAVLGVFYLLADTRLDNSQRQLLAKAQLAGRSLLGIVNDVLDLAKIEAGEIALKSEPYDLPDLLREIETVYAPQARQKGLSFALDQAAGVPRWLVGDAQRVRQIVTNLVGNALKFTPSGRIRIAVETGGPADAERLKLSVTDTGIGIAEDTQATLFAPFVQADSTDSRRFGGTGLGLAIVRQLCAAMGGHVGLESAPGMGSTFFVELPLVRASAEDADRLALAQQPLEIVVVDDNHADRAAMVSLVRSLGWRAVELGSGHELVEEVARRVESGRPAPDALLVDWHMPELDGVAALAQLSQRIGPEKLPAALVVSVHERERIEGLHHTVVADKILTKPLEVSALFNAVSESITRREGSTEKLLVGTRLTDLQARWLEGVTVLLVDDGEVNLEISQRLLEKYSAQVYTASDGLQALAVLREHGNTIDLVLMDIQMPEMDGLEATRRLRRDLGLTRLPVIALTAGALVHERERALEAGMNDFIAKPIEPDALIRTVRQHVERSRGAPLPMVRAADPRSATGTWPAIAGVDLTSAATRLDHDLPLFLKMLGWITKDFADVAELEAGPALDALLASETSRSALRARIHKLRGSLGTVGADQVMAQASAAESALRDRDGSETDRLLALGTGLRELIDSARAALASHPFSGMLAAGSGAVAPHDGPPPSLQSFMELLRAQDLKALSVLPSVAAGLQTALGETTALTIQHAVESLDFPRALGLIEGRLHA